VSERAYVKMQTVCVWVGKGRRRECTGGGSAKLMRVSEWGTKKKKETNRPRVPPARPSRIAPPNRRDRR